MSWTPVAPVPMTPTRPPAIFRLDLPAILALVVDRRGDACIALDVPAQVKLIRNIIEVAFILRLTRIMFFPVPLLQEFLRERIPVGITLGVEARPGVAVPIPGAAHATSLLEGPNREPKLTQTVQRIESCHPGTDDKHIALFNVLTHVFPDCRRLL